MPHEQFVNPVLCSCRRFVQTFRGVSLKPGDLNPATRNLDAALPESRNPAPEPMFFIGCDVLMIIILILPYNATYNVRLCIIRGNYIHFVYDKRAFLINRQL